MVSDKKILIEIKNDDVIIIMPIENFMGSDEDMIELIDDVFEITQELIEKYRVN